MRFLIPLLALLQPQPAVQPAVVSTAWLAAHLNDSSISIVDTRSLQRYNQGHIKGARHLEHELTIQMSNHRLRPVADLVKVIAPAGGVDGRHIILYGSEPMNLGWVYTAFTAVGLGDHVSVLDGNFARWTSEGRPSDAITPPAAIGTLTVRPTDKIVDADYVKARLETPAMCLIDSRTTAEVADGKLPGSTLVLWQDLYADQALGRLKSADEIRAMFVKAGYKPGAEVVTYCAVGMRASLMFFAARYAGLPAKVYAGSWADWSQRPGFPIVR